MARTSFSGPVHSDNGFVGDVEGAVELTTYTVSSAPSASDNESVVIYVSDGAAGSPILAFSNGTDWLRSDTGAAISAT